MSNPLLGLFPSFVESEKTGLASSFDQLIGLRDKLGGMDPGGELDVWGDRAGGRVPRNLSDLRRREDKVGGDGRGRMDWGSTLKPKGKKELCVVFANR